MNIEDYLTVLKECPEGKVVCDGLEMDLISAEYGVYDNWPILVNIDYESFITYLTNSGKYQLKEKRQENSGHENCIINYIPGVVTLLVRNYVHPFNTTGFGFPTTPEEAKHSEKQVKNHQITIMLHPYQEKNNPKEYRIMAEVITELANYFMKNKIQFCLPKSTGRAHTNELERIVYYEGE